EISEVSYHLKQGDLLLAAAFCREKIGENDFARYLLKRLAIGDRVSLTQRLLQEIPFRGAITTNFDTLLERSRSNPMVLLPATMNRVGAGGTASILAHRDFFPIVKIHGSMEDPSTIVLTQGEFRTVIWNYPNYREFVMSLFVQFTVFFYGYSFKDPNVDFV